jgi:hypothetical protein
MWTCSAYLHLMLISLVKKIERGSWRLIGQRVQGISTLDVPIGGCFRAIIRQCGGTPYQIGCIDPKKAFVIDRDPLRLLYVRPDYRGYRYAARKVFPLTPWKIDYDHALGRQIALKLGFQYVLIIRITPTSNRAHGRFERPELIKGINLEKLCFADRRIVDKWLGRRPTSRGAPRSLELYKLGMKEAFNLTLKQTGFWGYALGVQDDSLPLNKLTALL